MIIVSCLSQGKGGDTLWLPGTVSFCLCLGLLINSPPFTLKSILVCSINYINHLVSLWGRDHLCPLLSVHTSRMKWAAEMGL